MREAFSQRCSPHSLSRGLMERDDWRNLGLQNVNSKMEMENTMDKAKKTGWRGYAHHTSRFPCRSAWQLELDVLCRHERFSHLYTAFLSARSACSHTTTHEHSEHPFFSRPSQIFPEKRFAWVPVPYRVSLSWCLDWSIHTWISRAVFLPCEQFTWRGLKNQKVLKQCNVRVMC